MRETQFIGLNKRAHQFIKENAIFSEEKTCPTCGHITCSVPITEDGEIVTGMFNEPVYTCKIYTTKDSRKFEEFVQFEPWSSGPMIFLALRWYNTKESINTSLWTDCEMDEKEFDYESGIVNI